MIQKIASTQDDETRHLQSHAMQDEGHTENVLRPQSLADYIGQEEIKQNLAVFLPAARKRKEAAKAKAATVDLDSLID